MTIKTTPIHGHNRKQNMSKHKTKPPMRIVILHRGWIVIGRVTATKDEVIITDAATVRKWGTTDGLGQLAREGKRQETKLDACPTVRVHPLAIIQQIDCDPKAWP